MDRHQRCIKGVLIDPQATWTTGSVVTVGVAGACDAFEFDVHSFALCAPLAHFHGIVGPLGIHQNAFGVAIRARSFSM